MTRYYCCFYQWLAEGEVFVFLIQKRPKTMSDVLYRAIKYMNAKDVLLARKEKPKKRDRQEYVR